MKTDELRALRAGLRAYEGEFEGALRAIQAELQDPRHERDPVERPDAIAFWDRARVLRFIDDARQRKLPELAKVYPLPERRTLVPDMARFHMEVFDAERVLSALTPEWDGPRAGLDYIRMTLKTPSLREQAEVKPGDVDVFTPDPLPESARAGEGENELRRKIRSRCLMKIDNLMSSGTNINWPEIERNLNVLNSIG